MSVANYAHVVCEEGGIVEARGGSEAQSGRARLYRKIAPIAAAVVGVLGLAGVVAGRRLMQRGDLHSTEEKFGLTGNLAKAVASSMKVAQEVQESIPEVQYLWGNISKTDFSNPAALVVVPGMPAWVNMSQMANVSIQDLLKPKWLNRHDGNICPGDEEAFEGMCYKRCRDLTNGTYTIRSSAWSCCNAQPCSFFNSKSVAPIPCHGLDIAGAAEGGGCPHTPGSCMVNEEYSLGTCYKKCAILTNNVFPYRSAASSCCRYNSHLACLDAVNVNTSVAFAVGGGVGDGTNTTPSKPHAPIPALAEVTK